MCDLCMRSPCEDNCPNNESEVIIGSCHHCGEVLFKGLEMWTDFEGNLYCDENCALKYYEIRESEY